MPYKKNYRRKRAPYASKGRRKAMAYGSKAGSVAYSALKLARRLKDAVNIEYKNHQVVVASATPSYNSIVYTLNGIFQGDLANQRIGTSVKMQNLTLRGFMQATSVAQATPVRVTLINDKQNNVTGGALLWDQYGTPNAPLSKKLEATKYDSKILYDNTFKIIPASDNALLNFEINVPLNIHTNYLDGPSIDTITNNCLRLFFTTGENVSATFVNFVATVSYTDN